MAIWRNGLMLSGRHKPASGNKSTAGPVLPDGCRIAARTIAGGSGEAGGIHKFTPWW